MTELTKDVLDQLESLRVEMRVALEIPGPLTERGYRAHRAFSEALGEHGESLIAAARDLAELKSALEHIRRVYHIKSTQRLLEYARTLGWKP